MELISIYKKPQDIKETIVQYIRYSVQQERDRAATMKKAANNQLHHLARASALEEMAERIETIQFKQGM